MPQDRIYISDLRIQTLIGIEPPERTNKQEIVVSVILEVDTRKAGKSDNVRHVVDYRKVADDIRAHVTATNRNLVEAMAADIARICFRRRGVTRATVRVDKPAALAGRGLVGIEIERRPEDFA
jgi:FolB domain-containing protein